MKSKGKSRGGSLGYARAAILSACGLKEGLKQPAFVAQDDRTEFMVQWLLPYDRHRDGSGGTRFHCQSSRLLRL